MNRSLWDWMLARPGSDRQIRPEPAARVQATRSPPSMQRRAEPPPPVRRPARERYDRMSRQMLTDYGVRVHKWRSSMSGVAWQVRYKDGSISRLIEAPRPRGPVSAAIFLHEIGHHAIGFNRVRPRCLEEYHAWAFSLAQMESREITVTDRVRQRVRDSLRYAVAKARRRGLKQVPGELEAWIK